MSAKLSVSCAVLCILSLCFGQENSTQKLVTQGTSNETSDSESDESEWISDDKDMDQDASIWRIWRPFWNWGQSMLSKKFTRFPTLKENENGGLHYHRDRPKRKLKNKIKLLFKLKQFET
nr:uncharacterized protein LOC110371934 [Helicoverpa armigera]